MVTYTAVVSGDFFLTRGCMLGGALWEKCTWLQMRWMGFNHRLANKQMTENCIRILPCKLYGTPQTREFIVIYSINVISARP